MLDPKPAAPWACVGLAFSTVNDALGARPDAVLHETVPPSVREAVTYGRSVSDAGP